VVGVAFLSVAEIATLRVGDALLVRPESELGTPSTRATFSGRVLLAAPTATAGVRAEIGEDGTLRALAAVGALTPVEAPMDPEDKDALLTTIGDVPVLVRVEIGEATMPARDWASLARGDVVPLGRRVGGAVILRVGGLPLARGELVDVEGEVGVRIVERMGGGEGTP
jgi:type III secretion system YscQ/HrcQ family protein